MAATASRVNEVASAPLSILFLTPSLDWGGAEVMMVDLARDCAQKGERVVVVSMKPPRAFVPELRESGVEVVSLGIESAWSAPKGLASLIRVLRRFQPRVVHAHMFHASVVGRLLRAFSEFKLICTVHSTVEARMDRATARSRDLLYRLTDCWSDRTTVVGTRVQARYIQDRLIQPCKIRTIPAGVDIEKFRPNAEARMRLRQEYVWSDRFVWIAVGRLELAKDYPTLLQAFETVLHSQPNAVLAIVGSGSLKDVLQQRAAKLGLAESIFFLGTRDDVPSLLSAADGFVLSSAWEGGPIVLLEAAATELPIVSTDVGEAQRMVLDNHTGFIVPVGRAEVLSAAMVRLAALPSDIRKEMGRQSRSHVTRMFSLEATHQAYSQLYREVLEGTA